MFSLGLGHRMNLNEKAKHKAQQDLIQQLQTNEKLQATINQELEEKVKERTLEIEKQTEELKNKQYEIVVQSEQLKEANEEIKKVNTNLEFLVSQRTVELKRANKELDLFLYRSSHDLRGPLTTLLGLVELGYLVQKDMDTYNILDKVKVIVHNMDKTLEKLQMISEIDMAGMRDKTHVDFKTLLHQILEKFNATILTRGIKIEKNLEIHEPFESYANLIRIILLNLIENSIMFCYPSEAFMSVNISVKQEVLKIQILDNGIGIPENFKDKIFEMYVRASEMSKGNGLGLYVTKRAVLKLGGKIYLEESVKGNRVTCFTVEIPLIDRAK
jgi:signal transduction histidine kinase